MFLWEGAGTLYVRRCAQGKALQAATLKSSTHLFRGLIVISYVDDPMNLVPVLLATFISGYYVVKWDTRGE